MEFLGVTRAVSCGLVCAVTLVVGGVTGSGGGAADPDDYAPVDRPGPELSVPVHLLEQSLECTASVTNADRNPVLLVSATTLTSDDNYDWNWIPALEQQGIPWCASDIPEPHSAATNMEDIQVRGEYITYAIRTMHELSGRNVDILGHAQGGTVPRWSLRFWPDTREMVDNLIALAPANHGSTGIVALCPVAYCQPAMFQERPGSQFVEAMNSHQETFPEVAYTTISSQLDVLVFPHEAFIEGPGDVANILTQDVCPANLAEHLTIGTTDPVAEALAMDALDNPGTADPARIDSSVCSEVFMSGVNPLTVALDLAAFNATITTNLAITPRVHSEPPLECYVTTEGC